MSPLQLPTSGFAARRGFTLIELVALIAATLLIGAILFSAYRTYTVRAQIARVIALAAPEQAKVVSSFEAEGEPPANREAAGMTVADHGREHSHLIEVADGRIDIRFAAAADTVLAGRILSLTPYETATLEIVWVCGNEIPGPGLKPLGFFGGGRQAIHTVSTVEPRYLPASCR